MEINQEQFKIWHNQYRPRLLSNMTAVVKDRETAEEITAAALAIAWEKLNRFRGEASLYTWVYRIAMNEARNRRRQPKAVSIDALETPLKELTEMDGVNDEERERTDYRAKLQRALSTLSRVDRKVLIDHFVREYSAKRIARQNRIPVGTVLSRLFRAKRQLRAAWELWA